MQSAYAAPGTTSSSTSEPVHHEHYATICLDDRNGWQHDQHRDRHYATSAPAERPAPLHTDRPRHQRGRTTSTTVRAKSTTTTTKPAPALPPGYWVVRADGTVENFGTASLGDLGNMKLNRPIVTAAATPDGRGYWLVASNGGVFCFGDATFHGSPGSAPAQQPNRGDGPNSRRWRLLAGRLGRWHFQLRGRPLLRFNGRKAPQRAHSRDSRHSRRGRVLARGDRRRHFRLRGRPFLGSTGSDRLNKPIVGMAATPDGGGYWLVASDGGIFAFGDAGFHGSTGSKELPSAIVGIAVTPDGKGYWLVEKNGTLFSFGNAPDRGSATAKAGPKSWQWPLALRTTHVSDDRSISEHAATHDNYDLGAYHYDGRHHHYDQPTTTTTTTTTTMPTTTTSQPAPESPNYPYPARGHGLRRVLAAMLPARFGKGANAPGRPGFWSSRGQ